MEADTPPNQREIQEAPMRFNTTRPTQRYSILTSKCDPFEIIVHNSSNLKERGHFRTR